MTDIVPVRFPDGVASPDGEVAFIERRDGGISTIDLRSGHDLWSTDVPGKPVLVVDDRLIAENRSQSQGNLLQFVILDLTRQGAIERQLDPIVLPDWVSVADPDQRFEYDVRVEDGSLLIEWTAESHYAGGAPPPPSVMSEAQRRGDGRVRVDLHSGRVQTDVTPPPPTTHRTASPAPNVMQLLPAGAHAPAVVGERVFYLEPPAQTAEGPKLVSLDLRTGNRLWERSLPRSPRPRARRM
jgi:outer membrane protein assembly factor BamB